MGKTLFEAMDRELSDSFKDRAPRYSRASKLYVQRLDLDWIQTAAQLPGKAVQVALALWFYRHIEKNVVIQPTGKKAAEFGVYRKSKIAALRRLEEAGLVEVSFKDRRSPRVTICGLGGCQKNRPVDTSSIPKSKSGHELAEGE